MRFFPLACIGIAAFLLTALLTRAWIPILQRKKLGQFILDIGPAWHKSKEGTPTMGGAVFLITLPPLVLLGAWWTTGGVPTTLLFLLLFAQANGLIGLLDDRRKLKNKRNLGLLPWQKLFLQSFFVAGLLFLISRFSEGIPPFRLPFTNVIAKEGLPLFFLLFLLLLGSLNCVNLSDGIDGLTTSSSGIIGIFFLVEGIAKGKDALAILGVTLCGVMLGFFIFNRHPARIFMGDTGSLFLGALLSGAVFLTESTAVLPLYMLLFLIEGASVILQVLVFKRTSRRLLRMAPLHHHLEKCGWSENRIVFVFSLITLIACLFAHLALF